MDGLMWLLLISLIVGAVWWYRRSRTPSGPDGEVEAAPPAQSGWDGHESESVVNPAHRKAKTAGADAASSIAPSPGTPKDLP